MRSLRSFVVLCFVLFTSTRAQVFHVVAPSTLRLDSIETIGIVTEGSHSTLVDVYVQDHPGKIKNITATQITVRPGEPEILKIRLNPADFPPTFLSTPNPEKFVTLNVHSHNFNKAVRIPISDQAGYVFIQTDKPIYNPKQRASIRIIPLNEETLPSGNPFVLQIRNPNQIIVEETVFNKANRKSLVTHNYKFPKYPVLGEWSAVVKYGYELKQNTTVHFELQEYVLPTFTVELKTPDYILDTDDNIVISVNARYVYGRPVQGMVTFRVGVKGETSTATYFAAIGPEQLRNGFYRETVSTQNFKNHQFIGWFPEIEHSHLVVEATVVDAATGNEEVVMDGKGRFSKSPFEISFQRCLQDFKPGLVSVFEADITYLDGKPAEGVSTRIKALADGELLNITKTDDVSDIEGKVSFQLHPEVHHETISITLETTDPRRAGNQAIGHFKQSKFQSTSNAFIALDRSSQHKIKIGTTFTKLIHMKPAEMRDIYYAVISRGSIVLIRKLPPGAHLNKRIQFDISHDMVPAFRIVVWAHYDKELIADSLYIDIEDACHSDAEVTIDPVFSVKEPGLAGTIIMRGTKDTRVGLLGVDQAVYALSKKDLLTKAKVFKKIAEHDLGCGPGGGITSDAVLGQAGIIIATNIYTPPNEKYKCAAAIRRKREVVDKQMKLYTGFEKHCCALGMKYDKQHRTCEVRTTIVAQLLRGENENCTKAFFECCLVAKEKNSRRTGLVGNPLLRGKANSANPDNVEFVPIEEEDFNERGVTLRSYFRETWFFQDFTIGSDNNEKFNVSLPHSITTWVVQGVSVSPYSGICVSDPREIVSFKKIFVQLNLPYSVVRNEQVDVQATVYNYWTGTLGVTVYMYGIKDLCSGANEGEKSERKRIIVNANSAETVTFPVIPLKEGSFDLKVVALTPEGSDVIVRKLNVIPEGYTDGEDFTIKLDPTNQQRRDKRDVSTDTYTDYIDTDLHQQTTSIQLPMPQNFVPGTESCIVTVLGDQFGPMVETALNNPVGLLRQPGGCGEQNMMTFAPTLYVMRYLKVKGQITPEAEEKGYSFIRQGYGNQVAFRKEDGSYAAYQHTPTSTWLTAFVVKVFCQANELVHIDDYVMCSGVKWLLDNQQLDGSFIEKHPVYHLDMMGGVNGQTPLTAFTLITMEECKCHAENLHISKMRALSYLEDHLGDVNEPLAVAIVAYALSLTSSRLKEAANDRLLAIAKHDAARNFMYWGQGNSALDIETAGYALLTQVRLNDMNKANSIVNWLNSHQQQSGAFKSTQDTVVALQGLSEYSIRANMPPLDLKVNISSSNDVNFNKVLKFDEGNAHILQDVMIDKVGGSLFIRTSGNGVGSLGVKLRYNILNPPKKLCNFDLTVNVTEMKRGNQADVLDGAIDPRKLPKKRNDVFDPLPPDLIRVQEGLDAKTDVPILLGNPRERGRASLVAVLPSRGKRQDGQGNSKFVLKIAICARYLGDTNAGMSIVDAGLFSGFEPNEEELMELQDDPDQLIERYEKTSKGIVFYLKTVPRTEKYCFHFHVTREYIVRKPQTSIVKVYDYYNPDASCTKFYSPGTNSPLLHTLCEAGICKCAEGGCPAAKPFEEVMKKAKTAAERNKKLYDMACANFHYVWKVQLANEITKVNGFYNITVEIDQVIKQGKEEAALIEKTTRSFLARDNCKTAELFPDVTYLIMGRDGQKYKTGNLVWHRYFMDKTTAIYMWQTLAQAQDTDLQRALNQVERKLLRKGCDT